MAAAVRAHLAADLEDARVSVCYLPSSAPPSSSAPPLATIQIIGVGSLSKKVQVRVVDHILRKEIRRDFELAGIPRDAQPLALALSAGELLKASWAELNLRDAPAPAQAVPPSLELQWKKDSRSGSLPVFFNLYFATEWFSGGLIQFGPDLGLSAQILPRWRISAKFGLRIAERVTGPDGSVSPEAWGLGAASSFRLSPNRWKVELGALTQLEFFRLRFFPRPLATARGRLGTGEAWVVSAGAFAKIPVGQRLSIESLATAGPTLRGVEATDAGDPLIRAGGLAISARIGLALAF